MTTILYGINIDWLIDVNDEEYYRALCILFLPFRNENDDIHKKNVEQLYNENKEQIEEERNKFEKHKDMVNILREVESRK